MLHRPTPGIQRLMAAIRAKRAVVTFEPQRSKQSGSQTYLRVAISTQRILSHHVCNILDQSIRLDTLVHPSLPKFTRSRVIIAVVRFHEHRVQCQRFHPFRQPLHIVEDSDARHFLDLVVLNLSLRIP